MSPPGVRFAYEIEGAIVAIFPYLLLIILECSVYCRAPQVHDYRMGRSEIGATG